MIQNEVSTIARHADDSGGVRTVDVDTPESSSNGVRLTSSTRQLLRCPVCASELMLVDDHFDCTNESCVGRFPIVDRMPVLIDEAKSLFSFSDFLAHKETTLPRRPLITRLAVRLLPDISVNLRAERNYEEFRRLLLQRTPHPKVLVVGGSIVGKGMGAILSETAIEFVETDVSFGPRTALICDAHDLPFADGSFDGVIIQAVIPCLQDPFSCVDEIHRVLAADGLVYAETPFVQQGLQGGCDYTRFGPIGFRRLFRRFDEVASGAVAGPATVLTWSLQFFLLGFVAGRASQTVVKGLSRVLFVWVKYFDYYLLDKPGARKGASALYFLGTKSNVLSDRELVASYWGIE